ncbi:MAG: hypothetical protein N3E45_07470 [Oscillatoriaceae bacterium SKW80]|nr:hypothetical protein [Oscillatoriaceae bacterium SKYG93]MCX8120655.1 hypothetical protein [Oscillatoriaceae bacterium SKW80]MDW8453807.1 hypothetical protein [Oscillatoriaceae cyanobacterium SKYGB_i_bin93]HIK27037.1 isochorismate synthase [Oscillatoriaceae cyanobacterium M7585_C2015_266]
MNLSDRISEAVKYVLAASARIFGPNDDQYPKVGVQPFEGEPYKGNHDMN